MHLLVLGLSQPSVECLYHAVPLYQSETMVKRGLKWTLLPLTGK